MHNYVDTNKFLQKIDEFILYVNVVIGERLKHEAHDIFMRK